MDCDETVTADCGDLHIQDQASNHQPLKSVLLDSKQNSSSTITRKECEEETISRSEEAAVLKAIFGMKKPVSSVILIWPERACEGGS